MISSSIGFGCPRLAPIRFQGDPDPFGRDWRYIYRDRDFFFRCDEDKRNMMRTKNEYAEKLLSESILLTMTLSLRERCRAPLQGAFRTSHKKPHWKMLAPEEKNNVIFLHDCGKMHSSLNNERIGKKSCGSEKVKR